MNDMENKLNIVDRIKYRIKFNYLLVTNERGRKQYPYNINIILFILVLGIFAFSFTKTATSMLQFDYGIVYSLLILLFYFYLLINKLFITNVRYYCNKLSDVIINKLQQIKIYNNEDKTKEPFRIDSEIN